MTNKQITRIIEAFGDARQQWIDLLVKHPDSVEAAQHILAINSKCELLRTFYDYSQPV